MYNNKYKKVFEIVLLAFVVAVFKEYIIQGITCNDEVQLRLFSQHGLPYFFHKTIMEENIGKGRALSIFFSWKFLSYLTDNTYISKMIEIIFIIFGVSLFGVLIYKIVRNKAFAMCVCVLIVAMFPILFEHSAPNAFNIVVFQPMILALGSMNMFYDSLSCNSKGKLVTSVVLFFIGLCLYEFIIVYILAFPILACCVKYREEHERRMDLHRYIQCMLKAKWHCIIAVVYLILYVLQGRLFPSSYSGNQLYFGKISKIINVIMTLWKASFPGYFLFNKKYQYLFNVYSDGGLKNALVNHLDVFVFLLLLSCLLLMCYLQLKQDNGDEKPSIALIIILLFYSIIPAVPNSLTELYQNSVSDAFFTSLPVSAYMYFTAVFLLTYIIWSILKRCRVVGPIILCVIIVVSSFVQLENRVFAKVKKDDFSRISTIEQLFKCDYWKCMGETYIIAPSLYETRNLLAIEDGHWSDYASIYNSKVRIVNSMPEAKDASYMTMQSDNSFFLRSSDKTIYISKETPENYVLCKDNMNDVLISVGEGFWTENGFVFYNAIPINIT